MSEQVVELRRMTVGWLVLGSLLLACNDAHTGGANSQTHWLQRCSADGDCGSLSCVCGVCSATCEDGPLCKLALGKDAVCKPATTATDSDACSTQRPEAKICVAECQSDAQCSARGAQLRCTQGVCRQRAAAVGGSAGSGGQGGAAGSAGDRGASGSAGGVGDSGGMGGDGALGRAGAAASGGQQALDVAGAGGSGMGGSDAPRPTGELSCENGMPAHLPAHVELLATDVYEYQWTVSKNVLTTVAADPLGMSNSRSRTIRRQPLDGGNANTVVDDSTGINTSGIEALAADGADTVVREVDGGLPSHVAIRLLPSAGTVLNIALEVGVAIGKLVLDADSVYWMGLDAGQLTAWRTARAVADGVSLGSQAFDSSTGGTLQGPIAIGDWLYVATDKGQVLRASKSGATKLAAFGPALLPVRALATDDTDLLLMLDAMTDRLNNVVAPPRIVRMSSAGTVEDVTPIDTVGSDLAVNSGTIYWRVNQNTTPIWTATLWSAPADGSSAPTKLFTTPGNLLSSGLVAQQSSLYFAIYCRVDFGDNQVGGRTHILRYQP